MTENFLFFGQKFEIRHEVKLALTTKYETMTKNTNAPMTKTTDFQLLSFGHFLIRYSDLPALVLRAILPWYVPHFTV